MNSVLLTLIIILPLIGVFLIHQADKKNKADYHLLHVLITFCVMILSVYLSIKTEYNTISDGPQFITNISISKHFSYRIATDSINILFILITSIIFFSVTLIDGTSENKENNIFSLISQCGIMGILCSKNVLFLTLFMLLAFLPIFKICIKDKHSIIELSASFILFLVLMICICAGSVPLANQSKEFNLAYLSDCKLAANLQIYLLPLFLIVISVFSGIPPVNRWLEYSSKNELKHVATVSIISKFGIFIGFYIILKPFPEAIKFYSIYITIAAVILIIYKLIEAFRSKDLTKQFINYSSIHSTIVIMLLFSAMTEDLLKGIILSYISSLLIMAILLSSAKILNEIKIFGEEIQGLTSAMAKFRTCFLFGLFSMLSMPGTISFTGQFVILVALINSNNIFAFAVLLFFPIVTACYILKTSFNILYGNLPASYYNLKDIGYLNSAGFAILIIMLIILGFCPYIIDVPIDSFVKLTLHQL